jgi:hypothetical protein
LRLRAITGWVLGARDVNEDKVITGEDFSPTGLMAIEYFGCHEDFEVL